MQCLAAGAAAALLALAAPLRAAPAPQKPSAANSAIELHVGIRGVAYLGQPLKDLLEKAPGAKVTRNEAQPNTAQVQIPAAGITLLAVGDSDEALRVASLRFEFDRVYDKFVPKGYRTDKGIGPGSNVNDLVVAHGRPSQIFREREEGMTDGPPDEEPPYEKYQYTSPDGEFSTYFVVAGSAVEAVVINEKDPLRDRVNTPRPRS